jgi:hypothetical protein
MAMPSAEPRPGKDMATRFQPRLNQPSTTIQISNFKELAPMYTSGGKSFVSGKQKRRFFVFFKPL